MAENAARPAPLTADQIERRIVARGMNYFLSYQPSRGHGYRWCAVAGRSGARYGGTKQAALRRLWAKIKSDTKTGV